MLASNTFYSELIAKVFFGKRLRRLQVSLSTVLDGESGSSFKRVICKRRLSALILAVVLQFGFELNPVGDGQRCAIISALLHHSTISFAYAEEDSGREATPAEVEGKVNKRARAERKWKEGREQWRNGDKPGAISSFEDAIKIDHDFAEAHNSLGAALLDTNNVSGAIAELREATRLQPGLAVAHFNLGQALSKAESYKPDEAIKEFRVAIRLGLKEPDVYSDLGALLLKTGDARGALPELREAVRLKPDFADFHLNLGIALQMSRDLDGAIHEYEQAKTLNPRDPDPYLLIGGALLTVGDMKAAIGVYREAVRLAPKSAEAHHNLAIALTALRDVDGRVPKKEADEAIIEYRKAQQLNPGDPETANNLGVLLIEVGNYEKAIQEFRTSITLRPNSVDAHNNLGRALVESGQMEEAKGQFLLAIHLNPAFSKAYLNLGRLLMQERNSGNAAAYLKKAVDTDKDSSEARKALSQALWEEGRYDEAIDQASARYWKRPRDRDAAIYYGDLLDKSGRQAEGNVIRTEAHFKSLQGEYWVRTSLESGLSEFYQWNATPKKSITEKSILPPQAINNAFWNTWFEKGSSRITELHGRSEYTFVLDLSPYLYQANGSQGGQTDPLFLKKLNESGANNFDAYIVPVIGGRGIELLKPEEDSKGRFYTFHKLENLRTPPESQRDDESFETFSSRVQAGRFELRIKTTREGGCAVIGLSIWNARKDMALDNVVRHIEVRGDGGGRFNCGDKGSGPKELKTGLISLFSQPNLVNSDAALHIFRLSNSESGSVYIRQSSNEVYSWVFPGLLENFVTASGGFLDRIKSARSNGNYDVPGEMLAQFIFDVPSAVQCKEIKKDNEYDTQNDQARCYARESLKDLWKQGAQDHRPILFVRNVGAHDGSLFLPLGMMKVGKDTGFLADRMTIVQPLMKETYSSTPACIRKANWAVVLPSELQDLTGSMMNQYARHLGSDVLHAMNPITRWSEFKCYIEGTCMGPTAPGAAPNDMTSEKFADGLLLLAHHSNGEVWSAKRGDIVLWNFVKRRFQPGSVAILSACSTADYNQGPNQLAFLRALNEKNIDAAILTPFNVPLEMGVAFAMYFESELTSAYRSKQKLSLDQLFRKAIEALNQGKNSDAGLRVMKANPLYEFLIGGNPMVPLCEE